MQHEYNTAESVPPPRAVLKTIRLRADEVCARYAIDRRFLENLQVETALSCATNHLLVSLIRHVYYAEGRTLEVPSSAWDHIKLAIREHPRCPRWLRKRLRVRFDTYRARAYLPELPVRPDWGTVVDVWR